MTAANTPRNKISAGASSGSGNGQRKAVRYILPEHAMIGSYRIEKALGRGGMGEVYLAIHEKLKIYRAIKILLPSIAEKDTIYAGRFLKEAKLAITLQHPNIINVMDADYDPVHGLYYIVMEYVDGSSIRKILKGKGRFDEKSALKIVLKVAEALQAGEKMKIVHRDIKPDNIMMNSQGEVKLADLGIAKGGIDSNTSVEMTNPQTMLGTIAYISPEQAKDAQSVDCRADIYSLGVTLYEMLAGVKPYTGTQIEILQQVFTAPVPNIQAAVPTVSNITASLLKKMMAKDKNDRPQNFNILCRMLHRLVDGNAAGDDPILRKRAAELERTQKILIAEKQKIQEERDRLSAAKRELSEERKKITDQGKIFTEERKKISDEKKKISEKEKRYSEEKLRMAEARRRERRERRERILRNLGNALRSRTCFSILRWGLRLTVLSGLGFGLFYLIQTGIISKENFGKIISLCRNWLTPEEMKRDPDMEPVHSKGMVLLQASASPEILDWFNLKKRMIVIRDKKIGTLETALPGKLSLPFGKYSITVDIPECKTIHREFELKAGRNAELEIPLQPRPGTIVISCNVKGYEVLRDGEWTACRTMQIPAFVPYDLVIRAPGYKWTIIRSITLNPGETGNISAVLEQRGKDPQVFKTGKTLEAIRAYDSKRESGFNKAVKLFSSEVKSGNPVAAYYLGLMYENGQGMLFGWANKTEALKYYRTAARGNVPEAFYKTGLLEEAEQNYDQALKSYLSGAELGDQNCFCKLGEYYFSGRGKCARNLAMARHFLLLPARQNSSIAQLMLGKIHESEDLSLHDPRQAKYWYEKSFRNGNMEAKTYLEQIQNSMKD